MHADFHYYATYCAAIIAGYSHEESLDICYSDQFTDICSRTLLEKLKAPLSAATTQTAFELADARTDILGLQDITRIWASFHFLPHDLYIEKKHCNRYYKSKFRLICGPNGELVKETVGLAKGRSLQSAGLAMHVLSDTWAHAYFAGTPSLVINNTNYHFYEILPEGDRKINFIHSTSKPDDIEKCIYSNSIFSSSEHSIMNLGHGRAGHLPDYSFIKYRYLPAWYDYEELIKDNPGDYYRAFCQMIYAMGYLRGERDEFEVRQYAWETAAPYEERIKNILRKGQLDSSADWAAFGKELSGKDIPDFDVNRYLSEYIESEDKDDTFLGKFILAALAQKSMVTNRIYRSGNLLAGFSVDFAEKGFMGIEDFRKLAEHIGKEMRHD
ncbi:MAG: hypothetical protein II936_02300 [Oscillospiraceae bacterium]|nr:hypothetical protein [Oscillospiraceae bacterium]